MSITCLYCGNAYPADASECIVCGKPAPAPDYPNIILASQDNEVQELSNRYEKAIQFSVANRTIDKITEIEALINSDSRLVTACDFPKFIYFASWDKGVFPNFQKMLSIGMAFIDDDPKNKDRVLAEEATLPGCSKDITFAALSIEDRGVMFYGNYWCIWDLNMVSHRTSFFHANCVEWRDEINISMDRPMPEGYRSDWNNRQQVVVAKCYEFISDTTTPEEFSNILLKDRIHEDETDDFVEAHIWGTLTRRSLAKVIRVSGEPTLGQQLYSDQILEELEKIGVIVEKII